MQQRRLLYTHVLSPVHSVVYSPALSAPKAQTYDLVLNVRGVVELTDQLDFPIKVHAGWAVSGVDTGTGNLVRLTISNPETVIFLNWGGFVGGFGFWSVIPGPVALPINYGLPITVCSGATMTLEYLQRIPPALNNGTPPWTIERSMFPQPQLNQFVELWVENESCPSRVPLANVMPKAGALPTESGIV